MSLSHSKWIDMYDSLRGTDSGCTAELEFKGGLRVARCLIDGAVLAHYAEVEVCKTDWEEGQHQDQDGNVQLLH